MTKFLSQRGIVALLIAALGAAFYIGQAAADTVGGSQAIWAQIKSLEQQHKTDLANLDQQIAALREQIQTVQNSLQPLQAQRDTMNKQFEDQRTSLRDQVQPGYQAAYQTEQQGLASAKGQHDAAISAANQAYTTQRQQVIAQFNTTVQGLKKN